jgi:hypothetical protein
MGELWPDRTISAAEQFIRTQALFYARRNAALDQPRDNGRFSKKNHDNPRQGNLPLGPPEGYRIADRDPASKKLAP